MLGFHRLHRRRSAYLGSPPRAYGAAPAVRGAQLSPGAVRKGDAALSVVPRRRADRRRSADPSRFPGLCLGHGAPVLGDAAARRSEEHTSELQSLMRNSYAVFCLKKKTKKHKQTYTRN